MGELLKSIVMGVVMNSGLLNSNDTITLTQQMVDRWSGTQEVSVNYDLGEQTITLPEDCTLKFTTGSIDNGTLVGMNSQIEASKTKPIFGKKIVIDGSWKVADIHDNWFTFDTAPDYVSNKIIKNLFALASDDISNHVHFDANRTYYFELPYKGRADLGNMVSTYKNKKDGTTKRRYFDLYTEQFDYLRIFTIPSRTHVTINNTLQMLPTNQGAYFIFWEYDKHDVTIDGKGTIAGDVLKHQFTSPFINAKYYGEWGFIFCCQKCSNFIFKNITLRDAFGDCLIYRGSAYDDERGNRWASGLTMDNVKIINARRNGVAVAARDVVIKNCYFEGCGQKIIRGTNPKSAIDFETDNLSKYPELGNQNVLMENCTFKNNVLDVASVHSCTKDFGKVSTTIKNCVFTAPLKINTTYWLKFENCRIPALHNTVETETKSLYCENLTFNNCTFDHFNKSILITAKIKKIAFNNCKY